MNDDKYKECLNKIDEYYKKSPDITTDELEKAVYNMEYNILTKDSISNTKKFWDIDIVWLYRIGFVLLILLIGLIDIAYGNFDGNYYFACIFFLAGLFVGLYVRGFGLIFLLSHGLSGLALMIGPTLKSIFSSPIITDLSNKGILFFIVIGIVALITAFLMTALYNLSNKIQNNKYSLLIIFILYIFGILIIKLIPIIYGISVNSIF